MGRDALQCCRANQLQLGLLRAPSSVKAPSVLLQDTVVTMSNKKNEDASYDLEAAALTGALVLSLTLTRPCALLLQGVCGCCMHALWAAVHHTPAPLPLRHAGGGHAFKPLVGAVRALPAAVQIAPLVRAAHQADRLAVALDNRPQLRLLLMLYFALLHVLVVL